MSIPVQWSVLIATVLVIVSVAIPEPLVAQATLGEVEYRDVLPSGDTLLSHYGYGDWWFGGTTGLSLNAHLGNLKLARSAGSISARSLLDFGSGFGIGYMGGLSAEWNPPDGQWGGYLHVLALDVRNGSFSSQPSNAQNIEYQSETTVQYVTISPGVRYDLPITGLFLAGGIDFEVRTTSKVQIKPINDTSARIVEYRNVNFETKPFRIGLQAGMGYEFLLFEFSRQYRVRLAPYVSLHFGTSVADDYGSNWLLGFARAGVTLKLAKNRSSDTLLPFDPNYTAPPVVVASLNRQIQFNLPLIASSERLPVMNLAVIERPVIEEAVAVATPPAVSAEAGVNTRTAQRPTPPLPRVDPNVTRTVNFSTSVSTSFDGEAQRYLDALADYLTARPGAQVRIVGHTDAFGTPAETQRVSEDRANQVMQYLRRKGVPMGQIFASGVGARRPVADNRTEDGRRKNRRVEIVIVE